MKKTSLAILISLLATAGTAFAQTGSGVTMSTDPSVAARVEQNAQAIRSRQQSMPMMHHQGDHSMGHKHGAHKAGGMMKKGMHKDAPASGAAAQ